ncbi:AAA family ATPase, partial [Streptomyces sp. SID5770]|uniref:AAA family ATPase n=3 Tax=Streptomyces TaxID=1883 RepID=UPI001369BA65|nr:AAA family ATPase [Streptomyces sp. SID5770]
MTTAPHVALRPAGVGAGPAPVGREELLARLERALHTRGRALLTGPAGVGKTEVALAGAARAEARGETVLWLASLPSDREIPGASAAALVASVAATVTWPGSGAVRTEPSDAAAPGTPLPALPAPGGPKTPAAQTAGAHGTGPYTSGPYAADPVAPGPYTTGVFASGVFDELPGPQRTAVAMLCREAPIDADGWDPIALRLGIAQILRTLTCRGPVLLVVDGVQHVDPDSADLLRFALHLAPPALRVVAVETPEPYGEAHDPYGEPHRSEDPHASHLWVPSEADVLRVPPLHADEIAELLIHHRLPSRMAGRIHRASGGNPRLALAVGRSLADARTPVHHAEALTLSGRARDLARQLLG